jgi:hypothetical protein
MTISGSIGDPDTYLGAKLKKVLLDNGVMCWGLSASKYIRESISNVEGYLSNKPLPKLKTKARGPWPHDYVSELDVTLSLTQSGHKTPVPNWFIALDCRTRENRHRHGSFQTSNVHGIAQG